ncbi:MAG: hypothetical protein A3H35_01745 [Betaproteobacteria bacterium RIFCSPLOWO2_02_FULL_62_17]|nr:MAG: hypothetical protein A3H35_01745 [Betaproteobacteria bacterium RIFCSPLOWO2_02_FULL_62_17]
MKTLVVKTITSANCQYLAPLLTAEANMDPFCAWRCAKLQYQLVKRNVRFGNLPANLVWTPKASANEIRSQSL